MEEVYCEFKYSRAAAAFLVLVAALTLGIVAFVPLPPEARVVLSAAVIGMGAHAHRKLARVAVLRLSASRKVAVRDARGRWTEGALRDGSFAAPWLTILRWRPDRARFDRTLVILPDMLDADVRRRVRVIARWA